MQKIDKFVDAFNKAICYLAAFAVFATFAFCLLQFLARFVFQSAFDGSDVLTRAAYIWTSMLGAAYGLYIANHPSVSFVYDRLSPRGQKIHSLIGYILILIFNIIVVYFGYQYCAKTTALAFGGVKYLKNPYVYGSVVVYGVCAIVNTLHKLLHIIVADKKEGDVI